ncbi:HNH endonuclease signature motif containing protein [Lawsonella sp.]|uniref:HNH endonuclease n=1 Tax=Lawsonella sp. TaxID=2041415 RepID=UPI0025C1E115|nr:HNH endonuclease signature motif containing protein [Lawsonella sp.]
MSYYEAPHQAFAGLRLCEVGETMGGNFASRQSLRSRGAPQKLRATVLRRDHHRCQLALPGCTQIAEEVDHITPVFEHGTDSPDNLQAVCPSCHRQKTQAEARRAAAKLSRKRPHKLHPGLIF